MRYLLLGFTLAASAAHAQCGADQLTHLYCQIEDGKSELFVCADRSVTTYGFGPIGGPAELRLTEPTRRVAYLPWAGVGRAIAEGINFDSGTYTYGVYAGFNRPQTDEDHDRLDELSFGGVRVLRGGEEVALRRCIPETVQWTAWALSDLKESMGQTWDDRARVWNDAP